VFPTGHHALELDLAEQLGISRTPLREALLRLRNEAAAPTCAATRKPTTPARSPARAASGCSTFRSRLAARGKARNPAKGKVTCVDKANVFTSMAFSNRIFWERAKLFPEVAADHCYIDAMALELIRKPWEYHVIPTENQFGDILSDLAAVR
jgi:hypothetical protein